MRNCSSKKGSLLIEVLVAVAIFGVIAAISAQTIVVSLASNSVAGAHGQQAELISEMLQGIHAASDESWESLYSVPTDASHYHASISNGKWVIASGDDQITLTPRNFIRYFTVENVSRDPATHAIETSYTSDHDDPSTRLVRAYVNASTTNQAVVSEYFFRWRNQVCNQTAWNSSGSSGTTTCPSSAYSDSSNITPGTSLELCSGGC
jgi:type II secretory pathway pseudopilin PulG